MKEDFHKFESLDQFDPVKVNHFARLDAIPGFCLLRSEKEYLECYRALLKREIEIRGENPKGAVYSEKEQLTTPSPEEDKKNDAEPVCKKARKAAKVEIMEE